MIETVHNIWRKRSVLIYFVNAQLTASYRTKSLGFLWALPFKAVFKGVGRADPGNPPDQE